MTREGDDTNAQARRTLSISRFPLTGANSAMRWVALAGMTLACVGSRGPQSIGTSDWRTTGGDPGNSRYSLLDQINRANVATLRVAWIYHTGDARADSHSEIQAT